MVALDCVDFEYRAGSNGALRVFDALSLEVGCRERLAVIGPSGCGKTTLLNLMAGLALPISGEVVRCTNFQAGYLFQDYPFLPRKTVLDHVAFPRRAGNSRKERHRLAKELIAQVGLEDYVDYPLTALSTGMRGRVALATVLSSKPSILLLDEPFRALDLETRLQMWRLLQRLCSKEELSVVLVTHDLSEAIILADRVVVLEAIPSKVLSSHDIPNALREGDGLEMIGSSTFEQTHRRLWRDLKDALPIKANA